MSLSKEKVVYWLEGTKPYLVPILEKYFSFAVPMIRKIYLSFSTGSLDNFPYGISPDLINGVRDLASGVKIYDTSSNLKVSRKRCNLVIIVLTDSNNFLDWFDQNKVRNWDLWILDLRTNHSRKLNSDATIEHHGFMTKTLLFSALRDSIIAQGYKLVSFFDDDLETIVDDLNKVFEFGDKYGYRLYQPSLTEDSEVNHENLRVVSTSPGFRSVPIVEIMCPFLTVEFYKEIADLAVLAPSGWGFDIAISETLVRTRNENPIVLDSIQIRHARKSDPKNGEFYQYLFSNGVNPRLDVLRVNHFLGIAHEKVILRNISNINNFKNPEFHPIEEFDWEPIRLKERNARIAILMTKNESDVLGLWLSHHYGFFDLIYIVDDRSTDGTSDFLEEISHLEKIKVVKRSDKFGYIQREITTWIARHIAINAPESIIFPLDTDEFLSEKIILGKHEFELEENLWKYKWATAVPLQITEHELTTKDRFLLEIRNFAVEKIAVRGELIQNGFEIIQGNHSLCLPGSKHQELTLQSTILPDLIHIPIRSISQIEFKKNQANAALKKTSTLNPVEGFHWKRLGVPKNTRSLMQSSADYLRVANSRVLTRRVIRISGDPSFLNKVQRVSFYELTRALKKL